MSVTYNLGKQIEPNHWTFIESEFEVDLSNANAWAVMDSIVPMDYCGHVFPEHIEDVLKKLESRRFLVFFSNPHHADIRRFDALIALFREAKRQGLGVVWG